MSKVQDLEKFESSLECFLDLASHLFLEDEIFREVLISSGIGLERMNPPSGGKFSGLRVLKKYLGLKETYSQQEAQRKIEADAAKLRVKVSDYGFFPSNPKKVAKIYNRLKSRHVYEDLGKNLYEFPEQGEHFLNEFQFENARSVNDEDLASFVDRELAEHFVSSIEGDVRLIIPGFKNTSEMIGGFNEQRIGIITGQTGYGKTNLSLNLAWAALDAFPVGYINMEMSFRDITRRFAGIIRGVSPRKYFDYKSFQDSRFPFMPEDVVNKIKAKPNKLFVTDGHSLSVQEVCSWIKLKSIKEGCKLFFVDYDQKLNLNVSGNSPEWKELQTAMEVFEDVAKERNVHIVIMAQKNDEGKISGSKRSAYPAHYHLDFRDDEEHGAILAVATKNRHGAQSVAVTMDYNKELSQITENEFINQQQFKPKRKQRPRAPGALG